MGFFTKLFAGRKSDSPPGKSAPTPPTEDVLYDGCDPSCGYFITDFQQLPNREYEPTKKNGKLIGYCKYQIRTVRMGDSCKFAQDHPDKLDKSIFA